MTATCSLSRFVWLLFASGVPSCLIMFIPHPNPNPTALWQGCKSTAAQTIILRGANDYMLDEIERSLHDSLSIVKRTLESGRVVPGGGAVETDLCVYLEHVAETMGTREQLALAEFAQALLIIPRTLAVNGAFDATELVAQLRAHHHAAQFGSADKAELKYTGTPSSSSWWFGHSCDGSDVCV